MAPKVTVLLPAYNGGELLRAAIDSVLAQTFRDFELLVVDDCSSDGSPELVESFDDPRVRLLRNEVNLGQVPTLNRGIEAARGEYVARLDQDDLCLPHRLERQVAVLDASPRVGLVGSFMDVYDGAGHLVWQLRRRVDDGADFAFNALTNQLPVAHPTVLFRRAPVLDLGGYDVTIRLAEDQDLWRRLALAGHGVRVVPEALVRYRVHAGQQSQMHWQEQQENNRAALERFIAALGDGLDPHSLRLLLSWDDDFWDACGTRADAERVTEGLERLLRSGPERLYLGEAETTKLRRLLRQRVAVAARRSWRTGVGTQWRVAPPLLRFGLAGAPSADRAKAAGVLALAPLLPPLRAAEAAASAAWSWKRLAPAKHRWKRSASARAIYQLATRSRSTR